MKWEYLVKLPDNNFVDQNELDYLGDKGWELVSVDNGMAYFKRPTEQIPPAIVVVYSDRNKDAQEIADQINKHLGFGK